VKRAILVGCGALMVGIAGGYTLSLRSRPTVEPPSPQVWIPLPPSSPPGRMTFVGSRLSWLKHAQRTGSRCPRP
jgi:hypothetical protein